MTETTNAKNLTRQYKIRFSLTVEQMLAFTSSPNMVKEVKYLSPKFQTNCLTMCYVIEYSHLDSLIHFIDKL